MPPVFAVFQTSSSPNGEIIFTDGTPKDKFLPLPPGKNTQFFGDGQQWFTWQLKDNQYVLTFNNMVSTNASYYVDVMFSGTASLEVEPNQQGTPDDAYVYFRLFDEGGPNSTVGFWQAPLVLPNADFIIASPVSFRKTLVVTPSVSQLYLTFSVSGGAPRAVIADYTFTVKVLGQNTK